MSFTDAFTSGIWVGSATYMHDHVRVRCGHSCIRFSFYLFFWFSLYFISNLLRLTCLTPIRHSYFTKAFIPYPGLPCGPNRAFLLLRCLVAVSAVGCRLAATMRKCLDLFLTYGVSTKMITTEFRVFELVAISLLPVASLVFYGRSTDNLKVGYSCSGKADR